MPKDLALFLAWVREHAAADEFLDVEMLVKEYLGFPVPWARFEGEWEWLERH